MEEQGPQGISATMTRARGSITRRRTRAGKAPRLRTGLLELSPHPSGVRGKVRRASVKGGVRLTSTFRVLRARRAGRTRFGGQLIRTQLGLVLNQLPLRGGPRVRMEERRLGPAKGAVALTAPPGLQTPHPSATAGAAGDGTSCPAAGEVPER